MSFATTLRYGLLSQGLAFPSNGLAYYWSFDEVSGTTITDSVSGVTGSVNNSRVLGSTGFHNNGADFTQGDDYANLGIWGSEMGTHTISFWFQAESEASDKYIFGVLNDGTTQVNMGRVKGGQTDIWVMIQDENGNRVQIIIDADGYLDDNWHHFAYTFDSPNTMTPYLDGEEADFTYQSQASATYFVDFDYDFAVGCRNSRTNFRDYIDGKVDEFAIWNRVLTEKEISLIYNGGVGLFY